MVDTFKWKHPLSGIKGSILLCIIITSTSTILHLLCSRQGCSLSPSWHLLLRLSHSCNGISVCTLFQAIPSLHTLLCHLWLQASSVQTHSHLLQTHLQLCCLSGKAPDFGRNMKSWKWRLTDVKKCVVQPLHCCISNVKELTLETNNYTVQCIGLNTVVLPPKHVSFFYCTEYTQNLLFFYSLCGLQVVYYFTLLVL